MKIAIKIIQNEAWRFKRKEKKNQSLSDIWGNIKWSNMHVNGITEGEEKEKDIEKNHLLVKK